MNHIPVYIFLIFLFILLFSGDRKVAERVMTMVVLSSDKKKCAEYNRFTVQRNYVGGGDKKFAIVGYVNHEYDTLKCYPTEEAAIADLQRIFAAYESGVKTYTL